MSPRDPEAAGLDRRALLRLGATAALGVVLPARGLAAPRVAPAERELAFYQTHTGERLRTVYWAEGGYVVDALASIDHLLRDHRTGEVTAIDRGLLDLLHRLSSALETREAFHVISGYRSPATNASLAARGGVSPRSLHVVGQAIDVRVPGRALGDLRRAALELRVGGVGYYPASDFVHVDVGRVRAW
jgi:uncharacterized protein YcbK (DUF882 family)